MMASPSPLLRVEALDKSFPGVRALDGVNLTLARGEVLAVIGENGAGKSTLMKILAGVQLPDGGRILLDDRPIRCHSVHEALRLGIVLIHQELNLAENLDVAANISLGREAHVLGFLRSRAMRAEARRALKLVGLDVSPRKRVGDLTIGQRQMVEIAKALATNARILIMDEPTSSLSRHETETLFGVIRNLKAQGVSVIYISHRLGEVRAVADRVVALRDGKNAGELLRGEIDERRMVSLMIGRDASGWYRREPLPAGEPLLEVRDLATQAHRRHRLSFQVRRGEIVGIAGLVGAGRTELLEAIFGVTPPAAGTICVAGRPVRIRHPIDAICAGLALLPEDRKLQGLVLEMSVRQNISLPGLFRTRLAGMFLNFRRERSDAASLISSLRIRTPQATTPVQLLSGGNQQKTVLAKWLNLRPRVLLLDEPTRGVDIGAKEEIYRLLEQAAREGAAILFVSSEMQEVLTLADRVLVMHQGALAGQLTREQLSEEAVMHLATGQVGTTP
ncbi:MAG: sugar ABC transporter ATP-binding protein [Gemmataceae bacterium]|nr:sugar ABC transporter ATP-binding protein [Gemmataceae bacterium]